MLKLVCTIPGRETDGNRFDNSLDGLFYFVVVDMDTKNDFLSDSFIKKISIADIVSILKKTKKNYKKLEKNSLTEENEIKTLSAVFKEIDERIEQIRNFKPTKNNTPFTIGLIDEFDTNNPTNFLELEFIITNKTDKNLYITLQKKNRESFIEEIARHNKDKEVFKKTLRKFKERIYYLESLYAGRISEQNQIKPINRGKVKSRTEELAKKYNLVKGKTVPSKTLSIILRTLQKEGLTKANTIDSPRKTLQRLGYSKEKKN